MHVLTVNAGSYSVRLGLHRTGADVPVELTCWQGPGDANADGALGSFLDGVTVDVVAHRVVHGGTLAAPARVVDPGVERVIKAADTLAPLHNPHALAWLCVCVVAGGAPGRRAGQGFSPNFRKSPGAAPRPGGRSTRVERRAE